MLPSVLVDKAFFLHKGRSLVPADLRAGSTVCEMTPHPEALIRASGISSESATALVEAAAGRSYRVIYLGASGSAVLDDLPALAVGTSGEVRVFRPEEGPWTTAEIDDRVRPSIAISSEFGVLNIVISDCDSMTARVSDRLLKVVEEPRSGVRFWLLGSDFHAVTPTLRGRIDHVIVVHPLSPDDALSVLVAEGWDEIQAREALTIARGNLALTRNLGGEDGASKRAVMSRFSFWGCSQVPELDRFIGSICSVLTGARDASGLAAWGKMGAAQRSQVRAWVLRGLEAELTVPGPLTAASVREMARRTVAYEQFRDLIQANVPLMSAFGVVVASNQAAGDYGPDDSA